jgi:N-acetylneuraminic acid mutarotase
MIWSRLGFASATVPRPLGRSFATLLLTGALFWPGLLAAQEKTAPKPHGLNWSRLPDLPDKLGVAWPFAGVSEGTLLVAGGANFPNGFPWEGGRKVWHDTVYALSAPDSTWKVAGKLPRPLGYGVSATTPRGIVCAGGGDAERNHRDVFLLQWINGALQTSPLPPLPRTCANGCGAVIGDTLYVAGGEETPGATSALHTFWSLDLADARAQWQELPPWPGPERMLAASSVQADAFFLIGGVSLSADANGKPKRTYLRDGYRFDPKKKTWQRIADLPHPVAAAPSPAPAIGQSHVLLLGGDDGSKAGFEPMKEHQGFAGRVLAYHTITDTWCEMG